MARLVVGVVGAAIGFAIGGPAGARWGFMAGSMIGGALEGPQKTEGPRLDDLKAPQASYGAPIPYIIGSPRIAGVVAWASDKREIAHTESQGGKGGPSAEYTSYTYECDALYLLSINEIVGVRRIWAQGELIWSMADDADDATLDASKKTEWWRELRIYTGAGDQLPDPTYEAAVGLANAPAYRGRGYVFIEGLNLGSNGQMPILTFEVCRDATATATSQSAIFASVPALHGMLGQGASAFNPDGFHLHVGQFGDYASKVVHVYEVSPDGSYRYISEYEAATNDPSGSGQTDVSGIMSSAGRDVYWNEGDNGAQSHYELPVGQDLGNVQKRFCILGNALVLGSTLPGKRKIYRFVKSPGGAPVATSADLPTDINSLATDGTDVYALSADGTRVYVLDLYGLTLHTTLTAPGVGSRQGALVVDEHGTLFLVSGSAGKIFEWNGAAWLDAYPSVTLPDSFGFDRVQFGVSQGVVFSMAASNDSTHWDVSAHTRKQQIGLAAPSLDAVVSDLCLRTGLLQEGDIDVAQLSSPVVRAMAITQVTTTRNVLETLASAYLFETTQDDKLRFIRRGGLPAVTIPFADLGATAGDAVEPLPLRRVNDIEAPAQIVVRYANVDNDYQDGSESGDRLITQSTRVDVVELPLGLKPLEAKRVADARTMDVAASMIAVGPIALTRAYTALQPTDVVILTGESGSTYRARLLKRTEDNGVLTFEAALDDATVINSAALTDTSYTASGIVRALGSTALQLLDIPILRDADDDPGYYAAMAGSGRWRGATLFESVDDTTWEEDGSVVNSAVMGSATTVLPAWAGGAVFDEASSVTVNVGAGQLASATRAAMLETNANAMLIGDEIIQFRTATMLSEGIYRLTGLMRGRRGTEWATGSHAVDDRVVLLGTAGTRRVLRQASELGRTYQHRAVTMGRPIESAASQAIVPAGVGLKPFSVVDLRHEKDGSVDRITWKRRTRLAPRLTGPLGINVPLGEAAELYDVELRDGGALVASESVSAPQWDMQMLQQVGTLQFPAWGLVSRPGALWGVYDDGDAYSLNRLLKFDTSGNYLEGTPYVGDVRRFINVADQFYVVAHTLDPSPPHIITGASVQRFDEASPSSAAATFSVNMAASPSEIVYGLAHDGTSLWATERDSGTLRKLNASTLASEATYSVGVGITVIHHDSGSLWMLNANDAELIEWDIATATELRRFAVVALAFDFLVANGRAFVCANNAVSVYDLATGAQEYTQASLTGAPMCTFGALVAIADFMPPHGVLLFDATTGALVRKVKPSASYPVLYYIGGAVGSTLYLISGAAGGSVRAIGYELAAQDLTGLEVTVYQRSATVGRGYPASITL